MIKLWAHSGPNTVNHRTLLSLISPASPPSSSATGERKIKERRGYREAQGRWLGGGDPDRGRGRRLWWISGKPIWPKPYWRHYSKFSSAQWFCRLALLLPLLRAVWCEDFWRQSSQRPCWFRAVGLLVWIGRRFSRRGSLFIYLFSASSCVHRNGKKIANLRVVWARNGCPATLNGFLPSLIVWILKNSIHSFHHV